MPQVRRNPSHRPRELRRRVLMPARLRSSGGWTDACILNISKRGLMIHSARTGPTGSLVELWRGDQVIKARVIWQDGARAGLQAEDPLPVDDILSLTASTALRLTAASHAPIAGQAWERRDRDERTQGRMIEYAGVVVIALAMAAASFDLIELAFARPMDLITDALGR